MIVAVADGGKLHPRVIPAITRQGYTPLQLVCNPAPGPASYPGWLASLLTLGRNVCIIEHDVESRPGFLRDLQACPEPWCFFAYDFSTSYEDTMVGTGFTPLGHTRFRAGVGTLIADLLDSEEFGSAWDGRDKLISAALAAFVKPHRHRGKAIHWHRY